MEEKVRVALIILDGWGIGPSWGGNAISQAKTPNMDYWWRIFPKTTISASGEAVGLPPGASGNSETGHLNIGAGRIIPQNIDYINKTIESKSFFQNEKILGAIHHTQKYDSNLHLIGLVGAGNVHSNLNHLFALLKMAKDNGVKQVYLDLFTDGRDSDPNSGLSALEIISNKLNTIGIGKINSICGRYYAMDRDQNWGRTSRVYNALTKGEAEIFPSAREAISRSYNKSISDEYIVPNLIAKSEKEKLLIFDNDAIIFFNIRPDRARQISKVFLPDKIDKLPDRKILKNIYFATFVTRDPENLGTPAFEPAEIKNTLSEVISKNNLSQFHISETEKYAHVTYFFDGGRKIPFPNEVQLLVPSLKVATYDLAPAMSAEKITQKLLSAANHKFDFILVNFANADMVGHVGNYYATIQAIETLDSCLKRITQALLRLNYIIIITADHGNAEEMVNPRTNQPQTEHTANPVPFMILSKNIEVARLKLKVNGALPNIAPTILDLMKINKPKEMTADSLIIKNKQ